jgi:hypothetical protein
VLGATSKNHFKKLGLKAEVFVPESASEEAVIQLLEQLFQ